MELRYKANKIRDLVVYETGIVPVGIDIARHEVIIKIRGKELQGEVSEDSILKKLESIIPRKVVIEIVDD